MAMVMVMVLVMAIIVVVVVIVVAAGAAERVHGLRPRQRLPFSGKLATSSTRP